MIIGTLPVAALNGCVNPSYTVLQASPHQFWEKSRKMTQIAPMGARAARIRRLPSHCLSEGGMERERRTEKGNSTTTMAFVENTMLVLEYYGISLGITSFLSISLIV